MFDICFHETFLELGQLFYWFSNGSEQYVWFWETIFSKGRFLLFLHIRCSGNCRSTGSTLRTRASPEGRKDSEAVRNGNILATRAFIICILCVTRGIHFILEQPRSSVMEFHPTFQGMARIVSMFKLSINMSDFGGPTKKPTILYSSHSAVVSTTWKRTFSNLGCKIVVVGLMVKSMSFSKCALILSC